MPASWKIYRILCILQIILTSIALLWSLIHFFNVPGFSSIARLIVFLLSLLLATFALQLLGNNYPDTPVADLQKKRYNRLFLFNFISLAFLFGFVFAEVQVIRDWLALTRLPLRDLPFTTFIPVLLYSFILLLQFSILYGLFQLRRTLYSNFVQKQFDFEKR